jgi:uncharacterized OsmC-like protein
LPEIDYSSQVEPAGSHWYATRTFDHLALSRVLLGRRPNLLNRPPAAVRYAELWSIVLNSCPQVRISNLDCRKAWQLAVARPKYLHAQTCQKMAMTLRAISGAMDRLTTILRRRPEFGLHDDTPAIARWEGGLRVVSSHENGTQLVTDMPAELGGGGAQVTPGWLMRAGLASCAATRIAMAAAAGQIELEILEVSANSRSDARGLLGMADTDGAPVDAGPRDVELNVRISAPGIAPDRLRALVEESHRCSPVSNALCHAVPISLRLTIDE